MTREEFLAERAAEIERIRATALLKMYKSRHVHEVIRHGFMGQPETVLHAFRRLRLGEP